MGAASHFLSKDCFVCQCQDYWIILSTRRDQYLCVTHEDLTAIGHRLHGWDAAVAIADPSGNSAQEDALIESLTTKGIITRARHEGKPFAPPGYPASVRAIGIPESTTGLGRSLSCLGRFFLACSKIDWRLRLKPLSDTLARIERRRLRAGPRASTLDAGRGAKLIAAFRDLRPLYPRPYLCLFESLAQLEFLWSNGFSPSLVFGVVADPFEAHCWLQEGPVVLNDDLERVRKFTPIMSV
jgi:hypothetical protein